jgi:hypothetical protein
MGAARLSAVQAEQVTESPKQTYVRNTDTLYVKPLDGETNADALARSATTPAVQGGLTIKHFTGDPLIGLSLHALVEELTEQCARSNRGDLAQSEALLTAQAHSLDAIYNRLARMASSHLGAGGNIEVIDTLLRLGMKAQSQCRSTIEALAEIKNPSHVTFAKQANIANGPQQVNNGMAARAANGQFRQNKLLEQTNGQRLDFGAKGSAIGADTTLAAVGAVNRASDRPRKMRSV